MGEINRPDTVKGPAKGILYPDGEALWLDKTRPD